MSNYETNSKYYQPTKKKKEKKEEVNQSRKKLKLSVKWKERHGFKRLNIVIRNPKHTIYKRVNYAVSQGFWLFCSLFKNNMSIKFSIHACIKNKIDKSYFCQNLVSEMYGH